MLAYSIYFKIWLVL